MAAKKRWYYSFTLQVVGLLVDRQSKKIISKSPLTISSIESSEDLQWIRLQLIFYNLFSGLHCLVPIIHLVTNFGKQVRRFFQGVADDDHIGSSLQGA